MKKTLFQPIGGIVILLLLTCIAMINGCKKDVLIVNFPKSNKPISVQEAREYFESNFQTENHPVKSNRFNTAASASSTENTKQTPMWDASKIKNLNLGGTAVLTPLHIPNAYSHMSSKRMVKYGFVNYLMMYKNKSDQIITEWVELKPSDRWIDSEHSREYDGQIVIKNWEGKVKKLYNYENGKLVSKGKVSGPKATKRISTQDVSCYVTTTITIKNINPKPCPCDGHTYGQACYCPKPPESGYRKMTVSVEYDCDMPDDPNDPNDPWNPGDPGNPNDPNNPGGGTPTPGDYPPQSCNPDPNYTVPTVPPPPGTEYVLPCSATEIPTEPIPDVDVEPEIPKTPAELLIDWYNNDIDVQMRLSNSEMLYLVNHSSSADALLTYLNSELRSVKEFGRQAIEHLTENPDVPFADLVEMNEIPESSIVLPNLLDTTGLSPYPAFKALVSDLPNFVASNPTVLAALSRYTGFTKAKIMQLLAPGKGPSIQLVSNLNSGGIPCFGQYTRGTSILKIKKELVVGLDKVQSPQRYAAIGMLLAVVTLHEFIHYGRDVNKLTRRINIGGNLHEAGFIFELSISPPYLYDAISRDNAIQWANYFNYNIND